MANNEDAKDIAVSLAQELDPMTIPVVPFRNEYANGGKSLYQVEVNPINTQSYADAFRVFKEYISEYRSEIMQLVTGGTLLGATEKNTNSEELAQIHMNMYHDILDDDTESCLAMFNMPAALSKLARIFKDDRFLRRNSWRFRMVRSPSTPSNAPEASQPNRVCVSSRRYMPKSG